MKLVQTYVNLSIMDMLVGIGQAADALGISATMLRRWEAAGRIGSVRTNGGHRRHDLAEMRPDLFRRKPLAMVD
ncbi:MAG: MerR family DNA-binding transcriptional regulator [Holophagales bacterium]|nr:MerR family DNA-binding transcriptional regulator [Holophagales bacterium]